MVRRLVAVIGVALLISACGAPALSSNEAVNRVRDSMAGVGIAASSVRLAEGAAPGTYRAVATVNARRVTVTVDRGTGAFRRIEVGDGALTDKQIHALAKRGARTEATAVRVQQFGVTLVVLLSIAALGFALARRARLREGRSGLSRAAT
jgi:hypothetical protein